LILEQIVYPDIGNERGWKNCQRLNEVREAFTEQQMTRMRKKQRTVSPKNDGVDPEESTPDPPVDADGRKVWRCLGKGMSIFFSERKYCI
jgi:hypothetical protein